MTNTVDTAPTFEETLLEAGLSVVRFEGDYGLTTFLEQGGASTDDAVAAFLSQRLLRGGADLTFQGSSFGCSTISASSQSGDALFGRNFDWQGCNALIVQSAPTEGYSSIATVNMDFLGGYLGLLPDEARTMAALYAPLDGMNDQGLCVAVLMIQDSAGIDQNTDKPDLTTTTAVRLLLDQAADVEEALALLERYDMHASMGMMVHFALADAEGDSVAVEYVAGEMVVTKTPVLTNFYLAPGEKQGVGSAQSHTRYDILMERLAESVSMTMDDVKSALDSVSKDNFGEFESTEWSVVYNQAKLEIKYFHRENYETAYTFYLERF